LCGGSSSSPLKSLTGGGGPGLRHGLARGGQAIAPLPYGARPRGEGWAFNTPPGRGPRGGPIRPPPSSGPPSSDWAPPGAQFSIDLTDAAANGRPFSFRKPWAASSAEIARSDMRPPFGFCLALATFALACFTALALTGTAQLGDRHCLVELGNRAEHLPPRRPLPNPPMSATPIFRNQLSNRAFVQE